MQSVVNAFFTILRYPFNFDGFTFNLLDVIYAGFILDVIGLFIAKIVFFLNNER